MKKLLLGIALLAVALVVAGVATLYLAPGAVVTATQSFAARSAGLEPGVTMVDGYEVHHLDGGEGPPLLLLHGMADEKNSFAAAAAELTGSHRVILPDLLGHGENARDTSRDLSIAGQVALVDGLVEALGIERFALGGNSMGGHVAAAYALARPGKVTELVLVNAPGLQLDDNVVYGGFAERMAGREDFYAVMDRVVHTRPSLPGPIVDLQIEKANADFDFINAAAAAVREGADFDLKDRIGRIEVPTLILWGESDQVVRFNVAEAYRDRIPGARLVVLEEAGHSPQLEKPAEVGRAIASFLEASG